MDLKTNLPSRKPATAKETDRALRDLGFTNPLRTVSNGTKDNVELLPSRIPMDANVGQSHTVKEAIAASKSPSLSGKGNQVQAGVSRSASGELLKIDDLNIYMDACFEYNRGLREGWGQNRLLAMIGERQKLDRKTV